VITVRSILYSAPLYLLVTVLAALAADISITDAQSDETSMAIDAGIDGNGPTSIGRLEDCISVSAGETFQIDMVIRDVTDLLAWEASLDFDPAVVWVVGHDVKLFQEANDGSSVIDISSQLPDNSGFHTLSAFESSDPPAVDTGSGVLARLTLEARAQGQSLLRFGTLDINSDGVQDRGTLLKDTDADVIGDDNGDDFFDGERQDAMVAVGDDCPDGSTAAESGGSGGGGSSAAMIAGAVAGALAIAAIAIGAVLLLRRRGSRASADTTEA
jgi:hypothetical protein